MAPLPVQQQPALVRLMQQSPAPFWILTTVLTVGVLCLASWGATRLQRRYTPAVHAWVDRLNDPYTVGPRRGTRFSLLFDESHAVVGVRYKPDGDWGAAPVRPPPASWGARTPSPTFGAWVPVPPHAGSVRDWAAEYERRLQAQREARTQRTAWALYRAVWGTPPKGVCRVPRGTTEPERLEDWERVEEEKEPARVFAGAVFATWNGQTRRFRERVVPRRKSLAGALATGGGESPGASPRLATPAFEDDSGSEDGLSSPGMDCPSPTPGSRGPDPHVLTTVASSPPPMLPELPSPTKARVKNDLIRPSYGKI